MIVTRGRLLASALLLIAATALSGCSAFGPDTSVVKGDGDSTDVFTLKIGDCLNDAAADGEVSSVPTVDCAEPHDTEVFDAITLTDETYPGDDALGKEADEACLAAFPAFAGIAYDDSNLDYSSYYPTEASWKKQDRAVTCLILSLDPEGNVTKTTGTLKNAKK
ncbi:septum formation family protein [Glaciihabitans sp. dw_435]|uniref:septum formation family protein n=1 Tax=Glaciihabitans sp. dw_435 TaxID=2720081 RepID=UPI001BD655E0|nr:septum formation family protein [Glaciihabitans sp. dw_435]